MKFVYRDGQMIEEGQRILEEMRTVAPLSTAFIVDIPNVKKSFKAKGKNFLKNSNFAFAPMVLGTATTVDSGGLFWNTFLTYIFPWMLDIAKVYCLIRIAQAFYEEKRGGREGGTGFQALVQHGKWYLIFWLLPIGVELIDQMGHKMFMDLHDKTLLPTSK